jgi:hypothetical protein
MAWITVIFSLASCNRLFGDTDILQLVSVIQSYVIVAFAVAVLGNAPTFGQSPDCNPEAVAVIFRPFSASKSGRIVGWIIVSLMVIGYTAMTARDYTAKVIRNIKARKQRLAQKAPSEPQPRPKPQASTLPTLIQPSDPPQAASALPRRVRPVHETLTSKLIDFSLQSTIYVTRPRLLVDWDLLFMLFCLVIFWAFFVLNTELVIHWNQPTQADSGPSWQFGQVSGYPSSTVQYI